MFLFRRVEIAIRAFSSVGAVICLWRVHFGFARFFMAIPTGARPEFAYTKRSAASGGRFFRYGFMIRHDTAGSTLGLRAPDCAKESSTLWTLLRGWTSGKVRFARRGWGGADSRRRHPGTRKDPPGSDKRRPHCGWPGGSGCILLTFLALRGSKWNRHSRRAARRQRRGKCGSGTAAG